MPRSTSRKWASKHISRTGTISRNHDTIIRETANGYREAGNYRFVLKQLCTRSWLIRILDVDNICMLSSKLTVLSFYFFVSSKHLQLDTMVRVFTSACSLVEELERLRKSGFKLSCTPSLFQYAIDMANFTLLRILKSSFIEYLDTSRAKSIMFQAIDLCKEICPENNKELGTRNGMITMQLWNSDKAFKNPDGTENISLRVRTRLAVSLSYDAVWWWREEFGGQFGAYQGQQPQGEINGTSNAVATEVPNGSNSLEPPRNGGHTGLYDAGFFNEPWMGEFDFTNPGSTLFPLDSVLYPTTVPPGATI
jgi:hypothetical protein